LGRGSRGGVGIGNITSIYIYCVVVVKKEPSMDKYKWGLACVVVVKKEPSNYTATNVNNDDSC
jgi:hypothetical protein